MKIISLCRRGTVTLAARKKTREGSPVRSRQTIVTIPDMTPMAVTISVFTGVVFGLYPALRAAKPSPVDAPPRE